jgi:hypothetical protein
MGSVIKPSNKVAIIKFQRGMQEGLLGRISRSPVWEYHLFGTISEGPKSDCHYMVAGVQGMRLSHKYRIRHFDSYLSQVTLPRVWSTILPNTFGQENSR